MLLAKSTSAKNSMYQKKIMILLTSSVMLVLLSAAAFTYQSQCSDSKELEGPCSNRSSSLSMNDLQAVGSHNSYKLAIPALELDLIRAYREQSAISLDYTHLPLKDQLNKGLRQIELDILFDPEGGRYADPLLPRQTASLPKALSYDPSDMYAPGFKVLHAQDIDVRSTCPTWIKCLIEIRDWSDNNPEHVPILIMLNAKTGQSAYPDSIAALDFTEAAFDALDAETLSVFSRNKIITPDDVRGDANTLREAVISDGWPLLEEARGKVFFALDEGQEKVERYLRGKPSLEGLPMFVNSTSTEADHAAYFTINNPVRDQQRIQDAVKTGFIVRTRADANTIEARENSTVRRDAAFSSGAHYVSTDYYVPRLEFSEYTVKLPARSAARCNPVRRVADCN